MIRRQTRVRAKKILSIIGTSVGLIVLAIGFLSSLHGASTNLDETSRYTGVVEESKTYSPKGKSNYFLKLRGLDTKLRCYRASGNYTDLIDAVNVGDIVTVHYPGYQDTLVEVYQIEKNGNVILDHSEFQGKWIFCCIITILGMIWIIAAKQIKNWFSKSMKSFFSKLNT